MFFRNKRDLNADELLQKIVVEISQNASSVCEHGLVNKQKCLDCFISLFKNTAERLYNNECPLIEKEIMVKDNAPWYGYEVLKTKREKRKKERKWRREKNEISQNEYRAAKNA